MSLKNFGGVLDFAIELENEDASILEMAEKNQEMSSYQEQLTRLAKENKKNAKTLTRARQENVTEMILEPIQGLEVENYQEAKGDPTSMRKDEIVDHLKRLEDRAERFYREAAIRLQPVSDVAGTFQRLAKKRGERRKKLSTLS